MAHFAPLPAVAYCRYRMGLHTFYIAKRGCRNVGVQQTGQTFSEAASRDQVSRRCCEHTWILDEAR